MNGQERIGVEFTTNEEYQVIVMDYVNAKQVQIMFLDDYKYTTCVTWSALKKGEIKNPFHKSVYGVGCLGLDRNGKRIKTSDGTGKPTREYKLWTDMLQRCYDEKYCEKNPTYKNCTVCQRWLCFANFLEDISKIKGYELWRDNPKGFALNKDKYYTELDIETDCKEYSLKTVRFITNRENVKEMTDRTIHTKYKKVRCIELDRIFESLTQAEKETRIDQGSIGRCCRGERKTAGGKHWEFVD